ncbi:hypothetical protein NDU88_007545 [Pleurodeles waltl]|uniref:Uncharacterized protein n=1 Tax=Pleurodeles waltl TaxID=8319 RepID=A0AAV7QME4_PLEWA|nr:hypothetical protein NDU88_007545 [Pleurodeles waltl]
MTGEVVAEPQPCRWYDRSGWCGCPSVHLVPERAVSLFRSESGWWLRMLHLRLWSERAEKKDSGDISHRPWIPPGREGDGTRGVCCLDLPLACAYQGAVSHDPAAHHVGGGGGVHTAGDVPVLGACCCLGPPAKSFGTHLRIRHAGHSSCGAWLLLEGPRVPRWGGGSLGTRRRS